MSHLSDEYPPRPRGIFRYPRKVGTMLPEDRRSCSLKPLVEEMKPYIQFEDFERRFSYWFWKFDRSEVDISYPYFVFQFNFKYYPIIKQVLFFFYFEIPSTLFHRSSYGDIVIPMNIEGDVSFTDVLDSFYLKQFDMFQYSFLPSYVIWERPDCRYKYCPLQYLKDENVDYGFQQSDCFFLVNPDRGDTYSYLCQLSKCNGTHKFYRLDPHLSEVSFDPRNSVQYPLKQTSQQLSQQLNNPNTNVRKRKHNNQAYVLLNPQEHLHSD